MNDSMRRLVAALMIAFVSGACSPAETVEPGPPEAVVAEADDETLRRVYATWTNQLGLVRDDPQIWRSRLTEACSQGVWDESVAVALAAQYIEEDAHLFAGLQDDSAPAPSIETAADALWLMAVEVCGDRFPNDAIEEGPPFSNSQSEGGLSMLLPVSTIQGENL